jgi:hypothetical protein
MADYFTSFSVLLPVGAGNIEAALALYAQFEQELEADDQSVGFLAGQDALNSDAVWLWDGNGEGDPENLIAYAFRCAEAFGLTGLWGFHFSLSCSCPRLDGFGGGAQVLDLGRRESVDWLDTGHWLDEKLNAGEAGAASAETILQPTVEAQDRNDHSQVSMLRVVADDAEAPGCVTVENAAGQRFPVPIPLIDAIAASTAQPATTLLDQPIERREHGA